MSLRGAFEGRGDGRAPITASRRLVLGGALAGAAIANIGSLLHRDGAAVGAYAGAVVALPTRSTVLDPTSSTFGARGDGIVLGDLMVQAGSTTISSATAPFTSTEVDAGKLVVWRGADGSAASGVIASVRSATEAVLRDAARVASRSDGGPNTNAAIGTDNTAALDKAFASAQAAAEQAGPDRRRRVPAVEVRLPRGVFLLRALQPFSQPGVTLAGEGRFSTILASVEDGPWLQLGTFTGDPSDAFQGTAIDWTFQDLQFLNPAFGNTSSEGTRTGRGIQDNGSGGTRVLSCLFVGLEYGFCGAHGSDFSEIRESNFDNCDVGYYFGPGSQQVEITKTDAASCREGAVFEGAPHWHIGGASSFEDPTVAAITIEARSEGRTRLGVRVDLGGAFYSGKFLIDQATWFETNSGNNGRLCPRLILVRGDGPFGVAVEGVVVRDAYVIAGGQQQEGGTRCFLELDTARVSPEPVLIEDLVMGGDFLNAVFRMSGTAETSAPRLVGITVPDTVRLTAGPASGAKILQRGGGVLEGIVETRSDGGDVTVDAGSCNVFSCTASGGALRLQITSPPPAGTQRLTIEVVAQGGERTVVWPSTCRFAGDAPGTVASGTRTSVTLSWRPALRVWVETARAERVGA